MKFYHFTSKHHVEGCLKDGIILGTIPVQRDGETFLIKGFQWLTSNAEFNQSWCEQSSLPYDRSEYRLEIHIPKTAKDSLMKWLDFCKEFPNELAKTLNAFGDPENWWIFYGRIKPSWIRSIERKSNGNTT